MNGRAGLLFSLVPLVMWGLCDYVASKASRTLDPYSINFAFSVYSVPVPLIICFIKGFPHVSLGIFGLYFLATSLITFAFISMVAGFSKGTVGIVAPLANAYSVVTLFLLVLLFHEKVGLLQIPAVFLIVIGIALISYHKSKKSRQVIGFSVRYGIIAMILFGTGFTVIARINTNTTWYGNQLLLQVASLILAVIIMAVLTKKRRKFQPLGLTSIYNIIGGIIGSLGLLGYFLALSFGASTVLVTAIGSAAPLVTALLAYKFDHERLHIQQRIGTFIIVASVIYVNLLSK